MSSTGKFLRPTKGREKKFPLPGSGESDCFELSKSLACSHESDSTRLVYHHRISFLLALFFRSMLIYSVLIRTEAAAALFSNKNEISTTVGVEVDDLRRDKLKVGWFLPHRRDALMEFHDSSLSAAVFEATGVCLSPRLAVMPTEVASIQKETEELSRLIELSLCSLQVFSFRPQSDEHYTSRTILFMAGTIRLGFQVNRARHEKRDKTRAKIVLLSLEPRTRTQLEDE